MSDETPKTPRLGEVQPVEYQCTREMTATFGERLCGQRAEWHVMWDEAGENSLSCGEHFKEIAEKVDRGLWAIRDWHALGHACPVRRSTWIFMTEQGFGHCELTDLHPDLAALTAEPLTVGS